MLVERLGREEAGADTGAFKELFGVTRKYLIPILEYFDGRGLTRRDGNRRVLAGRP
jgi:selenocysteine-specific elongation factor